MSVDFIKAARSVGEMVVTAFSNQKSNLLVGMAMFGVGATAYFAATETPDVNEKLEEKKQQKGEELTIPEKAMIMVPGYRKTIATSVGTIGAIGLAHKCDLDKIALYSGAYKIANDKLNALNEKVEEELGPRKKQKLKDAIREDYVRANPPSENLIINTGKGVTLCIDTYSGRYFYSCAEAIKRAQAEAIVKFREQGYLSLNDWYDLIGLDCIKLGDDFGWSDNRDVFDIDFTSTLTDDNRPVLVVEFYNDPIPGYKYRY